MALTWLARELRAAGLKVAEVPGWQSRARPGSFTPVGVMLHHTAGNNDLGVVVNGRPDLPGPLANLYVDRHTLTVHVVAAGRANHAGTGSGEVLARTRSDLAPRGDAAALGLADTTGGNAWYVGIEVEWRPGQDWPRALVETTCRAAAAICRRMGWSANRVICHREWTRRKVDPAWRGDWRGITRRYLEEDEDMTPEQEALLRRANKGIDEVLNALREHGSDANNTMKAHFVTSRAAKEAAQAAQASAAKAVELLQGGRPAQVTLAPEQLTKLTEELKAEVRAEVRRQLAELAKAMGTTAPTPPAA